MRKTFGCVADFTVLRIRMNTTSRKIGQNGFGIHVYRLRRSLHDKKWRNYSLQELKVFRN